MDDFGEWIDVSGVSHGVNASFKLSDSPNLAKVENIRITTLNHHNIPTSMPSGLGFYYNSHWVDLIFTDNNTLKGYLTVFGYNYSYGGTTDVMCAPFTINCLTGEVTTEPFWVMSGYNPVYPVPRDISRIEYLDNTNIWIRNINNQLIRYPSAGFPKFSFNSGPLANIDLNTPSTQTMKNVVFSHNGTVAYSVFPGTPGYVDRFDQNGTRTGRIYTSHDSINDEGGSPPPSRELIKVGKYLFVGSRWKGIFDVIDLNAWTGWWGNVVSPGSEWFPDAYCNLLGSLNSGEYFWANSVSWGRSYLIPVNINWGSDYVPGTSPNGRLATWPPSRTTYAGVPRIQIANSYAMVNIAESPDKRVYFGTDGVRSMSLDTLSLKPLPDISFQQPPFGLGWGQVPIRKILISPNNDKLAVITQRQVHILSDKKYIANDVYSSNINCFLKFDQNDYANIEPNQNLPVVDSSPLQQNWTMTGDTATPQNFPRFLNKNTDNSYPDVLFGTHYLGILAQNLSIQRVLNENTRFTSGDFTLECWVYPTDNSHTIYSDNGTSYHGGIILKFWGTPWHGWSAMRLLVPNSNQSGWLIDSYIYNSMSYLAAKRWNHIALTRSGSTWRVHTNGYNVFETTVSTSSVPQVGPQRIGFDSQVFGGTQHLNGFIDQFKITKGVARYGSANFNPNYCV